MTVKVQKHLFTVEEFQRMGEAGIFREDDRVELMGGEIVEMTPVGSRHAACVKRFIHILSQRIRGKAILGVQDPVRLGTHSEPQPDITLLKPRPDFYVQAHPGPEDVFLVIEVADTSLEYDRLTKAPSYARAGVPETWIVNLEAETVEICRDPTPEGYRDMRSVKRGESVSSLSLPDLAVSVDDVLGPRESTG